MTWISVKDRLPEFNKDVIVYDGNIYIAYLNTVNLWFDENGLDVYPDFWHTLPEAPKQEETGY